MLRGCSSDGRAPALQAGGHRFDPGQLHLSRPPDFSGGRVFLPRVLLMGFCAANLLMHPYRQLPPTPTPTPTPNNPDPRSQIPDPRSQIPDPRSQIPDPRSQIPDSLIPDSLIPEKPRRAWRGLKAGGASRLCTLQGHPLPRALQLLVGVPSRSGFLPIPSLSELRPLGPRSVGATRSRVDPA